VLRGNPATEPVPPTQFGYTFAGWFDENGDMWDFATPVMNDMTLTAAWKYNPDDWVTVTFESNGGSFVDSQTVLKGYPATKPADPIKDDYIFLGWYTDDGTFLNEWDFADPVMNDMTLYADWLYKYGSLDVKIEVDEIFVREVYEPIYYPMGGAQSLVSWVGYGANAAVLPDGFEGYFLSNGFTYLKVDLATLEAAGDDGVNIGIATSNKSGGNNPNESWNTPIGKTYNMKLVGGQIVLTVKGFISVEFGARVSDTAFNGNPASGVTHNNVTTYAVTDTNGDGFVYFFFHIANAQWAGAQTGWKLADTEEVTQPYTGNVYMIVKDVEGNVVYDDLIGHVADLEPGLYYVTLFVNGVDIGSGTAVITAGNNTELDIGYALVRTDIVKIYPHVWP
ncbi:MAG: InlB B-repeat-containing protein, partial [Methanomassiliicoccaceae archaeon]|jgi:uncharacterized repeat protein (TIGR02543 family)|nr:InlB B-repeat-containing protein [Methanomassiliicoccaceae archaeon]